MTKSKSFTVVPLIFVIHLVKSAQFLNDTSIAGATVTGVSPLPLHKK